MDEVMTITGVTGYVGGRVAALLADEPIDLRLVARQPEKVPDTLEGVRVEASYDDDAAMRRSCQGAETLFLVSGREHPDRLEQHRRAVEAAVTAGVERIVYLSFLNAAPDATFTLARQHWQTEQFIRESGVHYVFLRDSFYTDMLPFFVGEDDVIRAPAGEGRASFVTRDDVAASAAAVLRTHDHDNSVFDITGPEALTLSEAARRLGEFVGRPIGYEAETEEEAYASRARYGAPEWEVQGWVTSYQAIANGEMDTVSDAVETLTGHPPRSIEDFLREHPESYRRLAGT